MDILQGLHLIDITELVIVVIACYIITAGIKQSGIHNKYMPFISMAIGIVAGLLVALVFHDNNLGKAGLTGFLAGGYTAGLFTGIKGILGGYTTKEGK